MLDQDLKDLWARADAGTAARTPAELEELLRPTADRSARGLGFLAWTQLVMLAVTAALAAANLPGYRSNPTMLAVEAGLLLAGLGFGYLAVRILVRARQLARADVPLLAAVERRLAFARGCYRPWLVGAALTPWMFSLAINTLIDNQDGHYPIHHPAEFAVVSLVMFAIAGVSTKVATDQALRELTALASDLQADALEETPGLAADRRRLRIGMLVACLLLVGGVVAGFWLWLRAA